MLKIKIKIQVNEMDRLDGLVRRCIDDYQMINEGERIAVGVSGGKDSLALLMALNTLKRYYDKNFELEAVTIDLGFEGMDYSPIEELCRGLCIPYTIVKTDIKEIVFDVRKEENPCSLCAKMRRGALHDAIISRGIRKIALAHHYDDAVETFLLSLLYEGRISCFKPVTWMSRVGVWQLRPLLYAQEEQISSFAQRAALPIVSNACPQDRASKRNEIKQLIKTLSADYPDLKSKVFGAMRRLPLDGWEMPD
jgi:tRNA(Ile)-lysidine synthetase-like protein